MKYCMECGSKIEASGGRMPKFCMECGESLDAQTTPSHSKTKDVPESIPVNADDIFQIEGSDKDPESSIFTFEDVLKSKTSGSQLNRPKGSKNIDDLKQRMRNRDSQDASQ